LRTFVDEVEDEGADNDAGDDGNDYVDYW